MVQVTKVTYAAFALHDGKPLIHVLTIASFPGPHHF